MTLTPQKSGWIEMICGSMFSGKTEELIRRLIRSQIAKQRVAIFKPLIDNRYDEEFIVSHNQRKIRSIVVDDPIQILDYKDKADVFGIDEAQFFRGSIVTTVNKLAKLGNRIIIAGLEKDYLGNTFGPMGELMINSEYITKVLAICVKCGDPANFTQRLSQEYNQIVIGESDKYEALCRKCFKEEN